jgi:hypothetical protein
VSLALATVTLLATAAVLLYLSMRSEPVLAFAKRDWVVIGDLVNVNADKTLDAALATAFRIGIEESRFINVVPDIQVRQALERMQRLPTTPIDRGLASEIALREQARAVIVPSVTQSGRMLRLGAEIVDPQRGRTVWVQTSDADGPDNALRQWINSSVTAALWASRWRNTVDDAAPGAGIPLELRAYSLAFNLRARATSTRQGAVPDIPARPRLAPQHAVSGATLYPRNAGRKRAPARRRYRSRVGSPNVRDSAVRFAHYTDPRSALDLWRMHADLHQITRRDSTMWGMPVICFCIDCAAEEVGFSGGRLAYGPLLNYIADNVGDVPGRQA